MRQKSNSSPASSETLVRNIRRATRKHVAAEEKALGLQGPCAPTALLSRLGRRTSP
jgi:hypothetical protein